MPRVEDALMLVFNVFSLVVVDEMIVVNCWLLIVVYCLLLRLLVCCSFRLLRLPF